MIKVKYQVFFTAVLAAATGLSGAEITPGMQETINRVDLGRQEVEETADRIVRQANDLASNGEYMKAAEKYRAAIRELEKFNSPMFNARVEFCRKQIADCYFRQAEEAMRKADKLAEANEIDEAIKLCKEAMKYCPEQIETLEKCIKRYEGYYEKAVETAKVSTDRLLPNHKNQEYQIQVLLEQGRKLAAAGDWGRAKRKFDEILLINPYNAEALQNLQMVNSNIGKIGNMRYGQMHRRSMAEVEWKYAIPVVPEGESSAAKNIISGAVRSKDGAGESALHRKLENMVIPRISLNEVTLGAAIKYLREQSRQLDPSQRAVNIILHNNFGNAGLLKKAQPQNAEAADGENPPPEPGEDNANGGQQVQNQNANQQPPLEETLVNLDIRNRSMLRAIQELCKVAKLSYRIDDYAVVISRPMEMSNEMRTRLFPVNITDQNSESIKQNLIASGIKFPAGSSIFYDNRISRLVATNTVENLRKIEEAIHELYDDQDPMIQLQLKFLEISQNDLNELAFNWQLSVNANNSAVKFDSRGNKVMSRASIIQRNSNDLLRYYVGDGSTAEQRNPIVDASLNYIWENSDGTRVAASMFALNWADSGDVLASPRITTISGQRASVQMTETHYYPESWETMDTETADNIINGWRMTGADPQPELENEQELGVSFVVQPEIHDKARRLIRVPISFPIKSFNSWMVFDARTYDSDGGVDGEYYKMPILNERRLSTEALVYDGETIVLGGIAQDNSTVVNDKIPILGDLPFIGRLFRSKYVDSQKSNLLIFMTCRLVKPDGTAFYPDEVVDRGVAKFPQL